MKIAGWEKFQGYTKRGPQWIKLHTSLIDQPQYLALPLVARAVLPALWITAARLSDDGSLPDDLRVLSILSHVAEDEIRQALPVLRQTGFVQCDESVAVVATGLSPQTEERRGEERRERETTTAVQSLSSVTGPSNGNGSPGLKPEDREAFAAAVWNTFREKFTPNRLTMSSAEFHLISKWMDKNIPLAVVLRGIGETGGKPRNLYASERAVARAAEYWHSSVGGVP